MNISAKELEVETISVLFRILPVILYGPNQKKVKTFSMFDEGSSLTLLDANIASEFQLTGPTSNLSTERYDGTIAAEESMTVTLEKKEPQNIVIQCPQYAQLNDLIYRDKPC